MQKAAPWLTVDADSYPAVVDGRLVWIVDGYTTSNTYPNSQRVSLQDATADTRSVANTIGVAGRYQDQLHAELGQGRGGRLRRQRLAVRVGYHRSDPEDLGEGVPRARCCRRRASPADLLDHFRYPQDLFKVQRQILARYHVTDPTTWYQNGDLWQVPKDPVSTDKLESPYYLSVKWPGDECRELQPDRRLRAEQPVQPGRLHGGQRRRGQSGLRPDAHPADVGHDPDRRTGPEFHRDDDLDHGGRHAAAVPQPGFDPGLDPGAVRQPAHPAGRRRSALRGAGLHRAAGHRRGSVPGAALRDGPVRPERRHRHHPAGRAGSGVQGDAGASTGESGTGRRHGHGHRDGARAPERRTAR